MSQPSYDGPSEIALWDPALTKRAMDILRPIIGRYFRPEVRGLGSIPDGGALVVSNHSGGVLALDFPVFAVKFYERFGYGRPIHTLSHDTLFVGPLERILTGTGFIRANRANALQALGAGALVIVFPGGDYDAARPTGLQNVIDFAGRTGYIRTAIEAGVPIVPMVSIGAQESQLYLSRGMGLARLLRVDKLLRAKILPISFGFPFGLSIVLPLNVPLPTRIVTQVLPPIDITGQFGDDPDIDEVDSHVRATMQSSLDRLARGRRLPVIG